MKKTLLFSLLALFFITDRASAYAPIIREYQSTRSVGMGGLRYTTGIFEDNFFANPARSADNPENLFQLPKFTLEAGSDAIKTASKMLKSDSDGLSKFAD